MPLSSFFYMLQPLLLINSLLWASNIIFFSIHGCYP